MLCSSELTVHHVAYAVKNIEKAIAQFELLGYIRDGEICADLSRNLNIIFLSMGQTTVELVAVLDKEKPSPVDFLFSKKPYANGMPYHICYNTSDIAASIEELRKNGFVVTQTSASAPAIGGRNVAFLYSSQIGIIELVEQA